MATLSIGSQKLVSTEKENAGIYFLRDEPYQIFAKSDLKNGDLVERCPMSLLGHGSAGHTDVKLLELCTEEPTKHHDPQWGNNLWLILGNGPLYTRDDLNANTDTTFKFNKGYMDIIANRDIKLGEKLIISKFNYNVQPKASKNSPVVYSEPEQTDEEFMEEMKQLMNQKMTDVPPNIP